MPSTVQLSGQNTYPDTSVKVPLTYSLVSDPSHGTVTDFNASTGTFTYTPDPGYVGTDTFQYEVTAYGPDSTAAPATSSPATVTVDVAADTAGGHRPERHARHEQEEHGDANRCDVQRAVNAAQADKTRIYRLAYPTDRARIPPERGRRQAALGEVQRGDGQRDPHARGSRSRSRPRRWSS